MLEGITAVAKGRPIVIQTLWTLIDSQPPPPAEITAYCARIREILAAGAQISLIQLHTIARSPAASNVQRISDELLESIAATVRSAVPSIPVQTYSGADVKPQ